MDLGYPEKRLTRADRDAVVELLGRHYALGSLDDEEFSERTDTAMKAKFPSDLICLKTGHGLTADLADLPPDPEPVAPELDLRIQPVLNMVRWFRGQSTGIKAFLVVMVLFSLLDLLGGDPTGPLIWGITAVIVLAVVKIYRTSKARREARRKAYLESNKDINYRGTPGYRSW
jgi:uncharacterized membrane protein